MLVATSRGAMHAAPAACQQRPVRRVVAGAAPAAAWGRSGSSAARLVQQLRELKQFKVTGNRAAHARTALSSHGLHHTQRPPSRRRCMHVPCLPHPAPLPCRPQQVWDVSHAAPDSSRPASRGGHQPRPARQAAPTDGGARPGAGGGRRPGIVWFRGDLRLHDHEALSRAQVRRQALAVAPGHARRSCEGRCCWERGASLPLARMHAAPCMTAGCPPHCRRPQAECSSLLPVYCFDPRDYGKSPKGYDRTGAPPWSRLRCCAVACMAAGLASQAWLGAPMAPLPPQAT